MTEKEYYFWSNSIIGVSMQVLQLFFYKNLYCCFCFGVLQFYFKKTKYVVQIMKCKPQMKTNKNERGIWGRGWGLNLASLKCAFLPWAWDISIN